jgi:hypothetical protein
MGKTFFELGPDQTAADARRNRIIWEPGKQTAELFLAFVDALERAFELDAGVVALDGGDSYALRADTFPDFAERAGAAIAVARSDKAFWNGAPHQVETDARRVPALAHGLRFVTAMVFRLTGDWPAYATANPTILEEARAFEAALPSPRSA